MLKSILQYDGVPFQASRIVLKVGTAVVSNGDGSPSLSRIGALVEQCSWITKMGKEVVLVYLKRDPSF